jgi:crotonobetainyl-CoA:carnitine CoA-transferase CaiB-like acyl-CoA transferase
MISAEATALAGLRVVDFGQYLAGPLVALMLAENGAEVIRVDPPGGPRWNHPVNAILQRSKRSVVLDLHDPVAVAAARALIESADVVIEGFRPGVMARLGPVPAGVHCP